MDALKNIITNVPDWLKRLDELGSQIDQRQIELAALGAGSSGRSIKNRGSTESLKAKDEGDPFSSPVDTAAVEFPEPVARDAGATTPPPGAKQDAANGPPSSPGSGTPSGLQKQTQQAMAKAQARARAQVRKRHRTESVISAEGAPSKYRTRSMIIVYYDSYVQGFFEELVKFISASRNLMRKAKMAAKVAQIRRLAELEMPDDDEESAGDGSLQPDTLTATPNTEGLPSLRYMSTRRMGPSMGGLPGFGRAAGRGGLLGDSTPDTYDDLDKGLEYVQGMCEHAAHQFLRDGECTEEIGNIQRRLAETREMAEKEMARVEKEEPELLKEMSDANKVRTIRPSSMRRELTPAKDLSSPKRTEPDGKIEPDVAVEALPTPVKPVSDSLGLVLASDGPIEADDSADVDEFDMAPPKLVYKSTRRLRA